MIDTYNYLATTYYKPVAKTNSSHDRKELKNIYSNIVKMNSESPTYMFDLSNENQEFALNVKDAAYSLSSVLNNLSDDSSLFDKTSFSSSDNNVVSIAITNKNNANNLDEFFVTVDELATNQVNTGRSVYSDSSGLSPGRYSFNISIYDEQYSFQFPVNSGTKNKDLQQALADFITGANIGITARVNADKDSDKNYISLQSDFTGCNSDGSPAFTIQDSSMVNGRGLCEYFDLDNVTKVGTNASFNLNGIDRTTHSNTFSYNNAMTISLNGVSSDPILIARSADSDTIVESLDDLTASYNSLVDTAIKNTNINNKSGRLLTTLASSTRFLQNSMESCGLTIDATGHMVVDKSLAYQAADTGDLQEMLVNSSGLVNGLKSKVGGITINPMEYIQKTIVTYPNISKPPVTNPYVTSIYSGMLFNYYC